MSIIINPGTQGVETHSEENAIQSIKNLIKDTGQEDFVTYKRVPSQDDERGYYGFEIISKNHDFTIEVDMPGNDPENVRLGKPWESPRLYVGGSSWLWGYAIGFCDFDEMNKE